MANVESPSATQPFCVWAQASRNFAIHIPPEVIGSLGTESLVALKSVPGRGLETGGILLGRTEFHGDTTTFWIEGFAPIESEHRFGPSYLLSESDFAHLQTELMKNGTASLGIYRSQTRSEELAIQDADAGLFKKCFGVRDNLFLMLAPLHRKGAFYFREDGNLKCVHQFALVSSLSSMGTASRASPPHVNLHTPHSNEPGGVHANMARHPQDQADPVVSTIPDPPVVNNDGVEQEAPPIAVSTGTRGTTGNPPSENSGARRWWASSGRGSAVKLWSWGLAAFTLAVVAVSLLSYYFRHSAAPNRQAPNYLYLTVERAGPDLRLLWDGNSQTVRSATRAVLHIQDGSQQSDRELKPSELLAGQYTYQPMYSAVTFRLNVYAGEPNAVGLVQVMFPPSPFTLAPSTEANARPSIEPASPPSRQPPSTQPQERPTARPQVKPIPRAPTPGVQSARTAPANLEKDQNVETELPAEKSSDSSTMIPPTAGTISPPAPVEPSHPAPVKEPIQRSPNVERNEPSTSGRQLMVRALTTPMPKSRLGGLVAKIPLVGRFRKQPKTVEAVPLNQPQPIVRMPNDRHLDRPATVGVKVYVSESGAVGDAEVVVHGDDYWDAMDSTLTSAALAAARNWTFAPSRVDDIPVASQMIIYFYFSP